MTVEVLAPMSPLQAPAERLTGEAIRSAAGEVATPSTALPYVADPPIPTMLVERELNYLHWLASRVTGAGRVVELGCFLGGSTGALVAGLEINGAESRRLLTYDSFRTMPDPGPRMDRWMRSACVVPGERFREVFDQHTARFRDRLDVREGFLPADASPAQEQQVYPEQEPIELLFVDVAKTWPVHLTVLRSFGRHLVEGGVVVQRGFLDMQWYWIALHHWQLREVLEPMDVLHSTPTVGFRVAGQVASQLDTLWRPEDLADAARRDEVWREVQRYWADRLGEDAAGLFAGHAARHALAMNDAAGATRWGRPYEAWIRSASSAGALVCAEWPHTMREPPTRPVVAGGGAEDVSVVHLVAESLAQGPARERWAAGVSPCPIEAREKLWRAVLLRLAARRIHRVALLGAGRHTRWLLEEFGFAERIEVACILDHAPSADSLCGVPVFEPRHTDHRLGQVEVLLPSSDAYETQLLEWAERLDADRFEVWPVYTRPDAEELLCRPPDQREVTHEPMSPGDSGWVSLGQSERVSDSRRLLGLDPARPWHEALAPLCRIPAWCTGYVNASEAAFLWDLLESAKPERIVEIGTASGVSTAMLAAGLAHFSSASATVRSYDVAHRCYFDTRRAVGEAAAAMVPGLLDRITFFAGSNALDAAGQHRVGEVDFAFIDASHAHPMPTLDLLALLYAVRPGGWVALHDIELDAFYDDALTGPRQLFEAWPGNKVQLAGPTPAQRNIGAVQMPRPRKPEDIGSVVAALLPLLGLPYETDDALTACAREAAALFQTAGAS